MLKRLGLFFPGVAGVTDTANSREVLGVNASIIINVLKNISKAMHHTKPHKDFFKFTYGSAVFKNFLFIKKLIQRKTSSDVNSEVATQCDTILLILVVMSYGKQKMKKIQ